MESEKVKEIKKALKYCSEGKCEKCLIGKKDIRKCVDILLKDTLTLINELESENERLNKSDTSKEESSIEYYNLYKDFKRKNKDLNELCELQRVSIAESFVRENQLKDRIAELEKENYEKYKRIMELEQDLIHADENVFFRECNVALKENEIKANALKQFAERLKENITVCYPSVIESIDETLKEFTK